MVVDRNNKLVNGHDLSPGQKRKFLFHASNVCIFHDILRGFIFITVISASLIIKGYRRTQFVLFGLPWVGESLQGRILEGHARQMEQFLVSSGS